MDGCKFILIISGIALFLACVFTVLRNEAKEEQEITVGGKKIQVEVARTAKAQYLGLSNREELCGDCGMLFVYPDQKVRFFVMRDMNFPLDIVWISGNKIVKIDREALPEGKNPTSAYQSRSAVDLVLEVNGGFCDANNIGEGDEVLFW